MREDVLHVALFDGFPEGFQDLLLRSDVRGSTALGD
jgi:hypothetical protein